MPVSPASDQHSFIQACLAIFFSLAIAACLALSPAHAERPLTSQAAPGCGIDMSCAPAPGPAGGAACGPAAAGSTCGSDSGVASQPGQGGMNVGAGNPVNLVNGNKYQREADLPALPGVLGLEIVRHFNSVHATQGTTAGIVGRGWKLSYDTELYAIGNSIQIIQADGNRVIFSRDPKNPSLCAAARPGTGSLRIRRTAAGEDFTWTWANGRVLNFDQRGKLMQIVAPGGQFVSLQRDLAGLLMQVTDPQGRQLRLHYPLSESTTGFRGVAAIDSPVGRFTYAYGAAMETTDAALRARQAANLQSVHYPDGIGSRHYHYEDARHPAFLTGISQTQSDDTAGPASIAAQLQRISTYLYDAQGRATLTVRGRPARLVTGTDGKPLRPARLVDGTGVGQVTLDFSQPGMTVIANSLGQRTVYRHAVIGGEFRLLEAIGPGCSQCGPTNLRYGWRADGVLASVTLLSQTGALPAATTFYVHDSQGRLIAQWHQAYDLRGHASGPRRLVQRIEYDGQNTEPRLIAMPSVVPGAERRIAVSYGQTDATRRLPVRIDETGFVPSVDGRTAVGIITRGITYAYDARGARTSVDGPLPNAPQQPGPANSDITRIEHDPATGLMTRVIAPGNLTTQIVARDAALRPVVIRTSDGVTAQTLMFSRNWRGQPQTVRIDAEALTPAAASAKAPSQISDAAGSDLFATVAPAKLSRTLTYRYDAAGRLLAVCLPGGLETRVIRDVNGRLIREILPDGSSRSIRSDTEDRQTGTERDDGVPSTAADETDAAARYRTSFTYDAFGHRLTQVDAEGAIHHLHADQRGRVDETSNALGIASRVEYDDEDNPVRLLAAADTPEAAVTRMQHDALGNVVGVTDPNGVTTRRWQDDFGRTVAEASPDRGVLLRRHDAAGRLIASIDETGITTRFGYDPAGRMISKGIDGEPALVRYRYLGMRLQDVTTIAAGSGQVQQQVRYRYDALGQIVHTREWLSRVDLPAGPLQAAERRTRSVAVSRAAELPNQPALQFDTFNHWDDAGRLVRQTLPDGHVLRYDYLASSAAAGLSVDPLAHDSLARSIAVTTAAAGLDSAAELASASPATASGARPGQLLAIRFDERTIVDAIRQDGMAGTGGILGYTNGNGVQRSIGRDAAGRVVRLTDSLTDSMSAGQTASGKTIETGNHWWQTGAAWFATRPSRSTILYQQIGQHDAAGRLVALRRQRPDPQANGHVTHHAERYGYDRLDRLTRIDDGQSAPTTFSYDRGGNRTARSDANGIQHYRYAPGTNRLMAITENSPTAGDGKILASGSSAANAGALLAGQEAVASAWLFHATGVPLAQFVFGQSRAALKSASGTASATQAIGRNVGDADNNIGIDANAADTRRTVYNTARRPVEVLDAANRPIAHYHYNVFGERVAKTVYRRAATAAPETTAVAWPVSPAAPRDAASNVTASPISKTGAGHAVTANDDGGVTTYSLYRDQRLAAQTDADGRILAHYIYLDGKPVAKVVMQPVSRGWQRFYTAIARLLSGARSDAPEPSQAEADIYAIHTDHLGTPQVVSNTAQKVVWQARTTPFGQARLRTASVESKDQPAFTLDLRLPGQIFDAETGLHYNYQRDYDPALGRYLTPDPIGLAGGLQPYGYVGGNPLSRTDRLGLYEEDIHYYMTYFLARAAGVDAKMAYVIATADQYIDNNPTTRPTADTLIDSLWFVLTQNQAQQTILSSYHFTQQAADDQFTDADIRFEQPSNPQLTKLFTAASAAKTLGGDCAYAVMYGEYLHAFEDTFAHRAYDNTPIAINSGFGHAAAGHFPDHTYNENALLGHNWVYNEARALEMEHEVFDRLTQLKSADSPAHTWEEILPLLNGPNGFNAQKENSDSTSKFDDSKPSHKIAMLNAQLNLWGYAFTDITGSTKQLDLTQTKYGKYDAAQGAKNRANFLRYKQTTDAHQANEPFKQSDFPGTLLDH